jgi:hypothetical protein
LAQFENVFWKGGNEGQKGVQNFKKAIKKREIMGKQVLKQHLSSIKVGCLSLFKSV